MPAFNALLISIVLTFSHVRNVEGHAFRVDPALIEKIYAPQLPTSDALSLEGTPLLPRA